MICGHSDYDGNCPCKYISSAKSIWTAALDNDFYVVEAWLKKRPELVNCLDIYGYSPLHFAAQKNCIEIVKLLLRHGAQVDLNSCGATPLHRACYAGHLEICRILLESGASISSVDTSFGDNLNPYQKAYQRGFIDICDLLVQFGAVALLTSETLADNSVKNIDVSREIDNHNPYSSHMLMSTCLPVTLSSTCSSGNNLSFNGLTCSICKLKNPVVVRLRNKKIICMECKNKLKL